MEINLINEVFFLGGAVNAKLYHSALQKGRNVSLQLTINKSKYEVFVPELFNILNTKEIPLTDGRVIDGTQYVDDYIEGYKNGVEYFKKEFPETHLMMNSDVYFSSLHYCYFHKAPNFSNGWAYWINSYPMSISAKEIEMYGFCAGIKFSLNHLKDKNPTLFKKIEECEHDLQPKQTETKTEQETYNDFTLSTIEDWLFEFKKMMSEADYKILVSALINYFDTGIFPIISKPIQINGRPNKKLFGWALNKIFEAKGKGVELKLLQFAKQNISLFIDVQFDENNITKSNLYKYFTTKTK
jgi:hypothetical protein